MCVEVSIIMNSYNRYPQCLYSLYALECQTFDLSKIEVIFVDDASSDETSSLDTYSPPYSFRYIRNPVNQGRAKSKNIGIQAAQGSILVLLDAELIVDPQFVKRRYSYHQRECVRTALTCYSHLATYSVYDKQFQPEQKKHFISLAKRKLKHLSRETKKTLKTNLFHNNPVDKVELFTKEDIISKKYIRLSFEKPIFPEIFKELGANLDGFVLQWICTFSPLSFKKSVIEDIGMFDESFYGYGTEDWEFGYRLSKYGICIINDQSSLVYHQEHPRNIADNNNEGTLNYLLFLQKHYSFEIAVCAFLFWLGKDWGYLNELVKEYNRLCEEYAERYLDAIDVCIECLQTVIEQVAAGQEIMHILHSSGIEESKVNAVLIQKMDIESTGQFPYMVDAMNVLFSL